VIVSRGIIARSYGDLGYDYVDSRSLFKENIELVLRLWREEDVHWEGRHRAPLEGFTARPRPVQEPNPPLWIGGGFSEESILLAAEMGLPLMLPSVIQPPTAFAPMVEKYRETFQDRGFGPPRVGALSHLHVAKDLETAARRYGERHRDYIDWVGGELLPWGLEPVLPPGTPPPTLPPADFEQMQSEGPLVAGSPQQVLDRLAEFKQACGLDRHLFHVDSGALPQDVLFESLEMLASEVLPKLRDA
jgi:alkanesulfonate monooxygenase SsuD/methylene tetrahydromethanopterin reductase-like flavin-dependent oxidoreductase (luciferase family)